MGRFDRTYRYVDGERVEGTWLPVRWLNGRWQRVSLKVYADGVVDCGGVRSLEEFAAMARSGVVVADGDGPGWGESARGGEAGEDGDEEQGGAEGLLGEVLDEVDRLAGRLDSSGRCWAAVRVYLGEPSEANREAVRAAYLAIPAHLRMYALGDMEWRDEPLVDLAFGDEEEVRGAVEYFAGLPEPEAPRPVRASALLPLKMRYAGRVAGERLWELKNGFPAPVEVDGFVYPTVLHGYCSLAVAEDGLRGRIRAAEDDAEVFRLFHGAPLREGWDDVCVAVMTALVRAKVRQHKDIAEVLLSTGDARLVTGDEVTPGGGEPYGDRGGAGMGRVLEAVRAELAAERAGLPR